MNNPITIDIIILAPLEIVWEHFTTSKHIVKWNFANDNWHCPHSESDLRVGGEFNHRMEAKDHSFGFDFKGVYDEIMSFSKIKYHLEDGRKVEVLFEKIDAYTTKVIEIFEPEKQNSVEMQREGWYAILNNFHKYVENSIK